MQSLDLLYFHCSLGATRLLTILQISRVSLELEPFCTGLARANSGQTLLSPMPFSVLFKLWSVASQGKIIWTSHSKIPQSTLRLCEVITAVSRDYLVPQYERRLPDSDDSSASEVMQGDHQTVMEAVSRDGPSLCHSRDCSQAGPAIRSLAWTFTIQKVWFFSVQHCQSLSAACSCANL